MRLNRPGSASSLAPDEQFGHGVVPDNAHQRAGAAPPDRLLRIDSKYHADVGKQADAADEIKDNKTAKDCKILQPLIAIGEKIV